MGWSAAPMGAAPLQSAGYETGPSYRRGSLVPRKLRIAHPAAKRLGDAEAVFIDEGHTAQRVAEALPTSRPLTLVRASLPTAAALANSPSVTVLLPGGRLRGLMMGTVDHWATRMLAELVIDLACTGANGISGKRSLTTPDPAVGAVKGISRFRLAATRRGRRSATVGASDPAPSRRRPDKSCQ